MSTEITSLKYFMKKDQQEEIVEVPGIESFKDDSGNVIPFKLRVLDLDAVEGLRSNYENKRKVKDDKGRFVTEDGKIIYEDNFDQKRYMDRLIAEVFVFPDMKDQKLMDSYGALSYEDMPRKMFPKFKDYRYVLNAVTEVLGIRDSNGESVIKQAKN